jgi:hypothetical protein
VSTRLPTVVEEPEEEVWEEEEDTSRADTVVDTVASSREVTAATSTFPFFHNHSPQLLDVIG